MIAAPIRERANPILHEWLSMALSRIGGIASDSRLIQACYDLIHCFRYGQGGCI